MQNQPVARNIPSAVFLKPLTDIKDAHAAHLASTQALRVEVNQRLMRVMQLHESLPTYLRARQLFEVEDAINVVTTDLQTNKKNTLLAIEGLHRIAKDALGLDPIHREAALQIVHEAEKISKDTISTIDIILSEIDLTNSQLLTIH